MGIIKGWLDEIIIVAATAVLVWLFKNYIHPFILGVLQRTPNLSGDWNSYDVENGVEIPKGRMEIRQIGNLINATVRRKRDDHQKERVFKYRGTISSGQVLLIWKETKSHGYNMGTMTLLLSSDLDKLQGMSIFYHKDKAKIICQDKVYRKINS
jgi:hypothetical protein